MNRALSTPFTVNSLLRTDDCFFHTTASWLRMTDFPWWNLGLSKVPGFGN